MNSGDWVETMSALVEHLDGTWEIINYEDLVKEEINTKHPQNHKLLKYPSLESTVVGKNMPEMQL